MLSGEIKTTCRGLNFWAHVSTFCQKVCDFSNLHDIGKHKNGTENEVVGVQLEDFAIEQDLEIEQHQKRQDGNSNQSVHDDNERQLQAVNADERSDGEHEDDQEEQKEQGGPLREVHWHC